MPDLNGEFVESATLSDDLAPESLPSLSDFAEEVGGPLPRGWYKAEVVEGYATRSGKQFLTNDEVSKNGESRNLTLCFRITPAKGDPRNLQERLNYRASDFTTERLGYIKEMREEMKGVKGRWSDSDAQRSSLAIANLGQIEKAVGFGFKRNSAGALVPAGLIGQVMDVRLSIDDNGYNEVTAHAKAGTFTAAPAKGNGKAKSE